MNAHLIEMKYSGATDTRGSRVALISKRFPNDRIHEGYNSDIGSTWRQGEKILELLGYTVICTAECGNTYMAAVKEFKPLKEAEAEFQEKRRVINGAWGSDS